MLASSVEHLFVARFLSGLSTGGVFALVPLYVSEIADARIRGSLSSLFLLSINAGTLLMFIAGTYVNYSLVSKLMLCVPIIFAMTFLLFTETPYYLLKCNKHKKAENALKFLRGCENFNETPEKVKKELLNIAKKVEEDGSSKNISIIDELSNFKDFLISNLLNLIIFYLRITCSEKSFNYRHCLGGSQSVLWGICVHKLHSRNFRRVRFKFKCKYVGYHNRNRPAAWLCALHTNHRENDEEVSLHHNMSRNYSWIISIRGTWNALKINGYVSV